MADYPDWGDARPFFLMLDPGTGNPQRLRHENGSIGVIPIEAELVVIDSGALNISTLTPVFAWRNLSAYTMVVFEAWSDAANDINLVVEKSPDSSHPNVDQGLSTATTGKSASIEVHTVMHQYWRMSAYVSGFTLQAMSWRLRGLPKVL